MKTTVSEHQFVDSFRACGRESQFTRPALFALFDYFESYEEDCGIEIELDPIGICCDWAEYKSAKAAADQFRKSFDSESEALNWLLNRTTVIEFTGGVIIQQF